MSFFKNQTFVAVDLETTGVDAEKDKIIEFAGVLVENGKVIKQLEFVINPEIEISPQVQAITGITNEEVKDKPIFENVKTQIQDFVKDALIVGHNVQFDIAFLGQNGVKTSGQSLDTYTLSSLFFAEEKSLALEVLSESFQIEHKYKHRALGDILATVELLKIIHKKIQELPPETLEKIQDYLCDKKHPLQTLFSNVQQKSFFEEKMQMSLFQGKPEKEDEPLPQVSEKSIQIFTDIFEQENHTVLEIPFQSQTILEAIQFLHKNSKPSVLAFYSPKLLNKTICSLQDAGFHEFCVLKNPHNYLCKQKFEKFRNKINPSEIEINLILKLIIWLDKTKSGDRDELAITYDEYPIWYKELCSNDSCSGREHSECFWHLAQHKTHSNNLVLTYQNLLLESILPVKENLVVPEARDLEKSLSTLGAQKIELENFTDILRHFQSSAELQSQHTQIKSIIDNLEVFWGYLHRELTQKLTDFVYPQKIVFNQSLKTQSGFLELRQSLKEVLTKIDELLNYVGNFTKFKFQTNQLKNLLQDLQDFFDEQHENEVRFFMAFPSGELNLQIAIIDLKPKTSDILKKFPRLICFDENLATMNGDNEYGFEYWKSSLGFEDSVWNERTLSQKKEGKGSVDLTYLLSKPTNQNAFEKTCALIKETVVNNQGKTLVLFTSYANIKTYFEALALDLQEIGYKVLAQGQGGGTKKIKAIFEQFPDKSVIFGIERSYHRDFFNAKDIKTVILHKLVFDFPNDPLIKARQEKYQNTFMDFSLPRSILSFKQTYLKLQNSEQNLIPLDTRLTEKRYGKYFLDSVKEL